MTTETTILTTQNSLDEILAIMKKLEKIIENEVSIKVKIITSIISISVLLLFGCTAPIFGFLMSRAKLSIQNRSKKDIKEYVPQINSMLLKKSFSEEKFSVNRKPIGILESLAGGIIEDGFTVEVKTFNSTDSKEGKTLPILENSDELTKELEEKSKWEQNEQNRKKDFYGKSLGALLIYGSYGTGKTYIAERFAEHSFGNKGIYLKIPCKDLLIRSSDGKEKSTDELQSTLMNIKKFIKALSDKINDSNALIVLNLDETDVHQDLYKYLQSMLDEEFTENKSKNSFKTSRMLVCSTNKTGNISRDTDSAKTSHRIRKAECLAYTKEQFFSLLDKEHGKSWINFLLNSKGVENTFDNAKSIIKKRVDEIANKKIKDLLDIISNECYKDSNIKEILSKLQSSKNVETLKHACTLHLLISGGKLECDEHSFDSKAIAEFESFIKKTKSSDEITQYLLENCRFLDFREIENDVKPMIQNNSNLNFHSASQTVQNQNK